MQLNGLMDYHARLYLNIHCVWLVGLACNLENMMFEDNL